jgi:FkbM family methyltransferase
MEADVLADLYDLQMVAFGSNNEDVVLMRAFGQTRHGYFVDVGAADPVLANVVKNLSEHLNWSGVHIEPDPKFAASLRRAYPTDHVVEAVAGDRDCETEFFEVDDGWLSTADPRIAAGHSTEGRSVRPRRIPAFTLDTILETVGAPPRIDLLKIDVEGAEPQVLAGLSLARWKPRVVLVESTEPMTPRRAVNNLAEILTRHGYRRTLFDGTNDFYVGPGEDLDFIEALSVPANIFDRFIPLIWYAKIANERRPQVRLVPRGLT